MATKTIAPPTKTIRFDPGVLNVLRDQVVWADDGLSATMPQLDRKMYDKVAKAFELMGGKWNRKAKATLFTFDPRPQVEGLVESGAMKVELDGFFRTPEAVARHILARISVNGNDYNWLEPSAGDGAIVRVLLDIGFLPERIYTIEKNTQRCAELRKTGVRVANGDFLKFRNSVHIPFNRILMNPPFERGQDILHVLKAYHHLAPYGVMAAIMSEGAFYRGDCLAREFRGWLAQVGGKSEKLPEGSFRESGTDVSTRFVIIRKIGG